MSTDILEGIDVSKWNGPIAWPRVRAAGVACAYIRATDALTPDPRFQQNFAAARAAGLKVGAYHYLRRRHAGEQARAFLCATGTYTGDLPPALDVENNGEEKLQVNDIFEWLDIVEHVVGKLPVIYTSGSMWDGVLKLPSDPAWAVYPVWAAHWTTKPKPTLPSPWRRADAEYFGWQYGVAGVQPWAADVDGIAGKVDRDRFRIGQGKS